MKCLSALAVAEPKAKWVPMDQYESRKQQAVEHRVNSLNTVDNLVLCVAMNVPYIAITQASSELHNQSIN